MREILIIRWITLFGELSEQSCLRYEPAQFAFDKYQKCKICLICLFFCILSNPQ